VRGLPPFGKAAGDHRRGRGVGRRGGRGFCGEGGSATPG
jgi:hypothetical protein